MTRYNGRNAKAMSGKGKTHTVADLGGGLFEVTSGSSGKLYTVTMRADGTSLCTCDWGKWTKVGHAVACSHTLAVLEWLANGEGKRTSAWASAAAAARQHRPTVDTGDGVWVTLRK